MVLIGSIKTNVVERCILQRDGGSDGSSDRGCADEESARGGGGDKVDFMADEYTDMVAVCISSFPYYATTHR